MEIRQEIKLEVTDETEVEVKSECSSGSVSKSDWCWFL